MEWRLSVLREEEVNPLEIEPMFLDWESNQEGLLFRPLDLLELKKSSPQILLRKGIHVLLIDLLWMNQNSPHLQDLRHPKSAESMEMQSKSIRL